MNHNRNLSIKWACTFILIGIAALATCVAGLIYKEYIIALATGLVFCAQVINFIKWKK